MSDPGLMVHPAATANQAATVIPSSSPAIPARLPHRQAGALESLQSLLYVLVISLFVITFTVQPIRIPSESMEPTLLVGDFLLMDKQVVPGTSHGLLPPTEIRRGDIIVFHEPVDDPSVHLVKRVIAVPGDRIHLQNGVVYRNGQPLQESYAVYRRTPPDPYRDNFPDLQTMDARVNPNWWIRLRTLAAQGDLTVPPGSYFVMGDNRNDSEDSRYWGFVPRTSIVGRPWMIYFSVPELEGASHSPEALAPGASTTENRSAYGRWDRIFRIVH